MAEPQAAADQDPKKYKGQPWILFDTVAAHSFMLGDDTAAGKAIGSDGPAVSSNGEIIFFQSSGRTKARMPWYTNQDLSGQVAYGLQVWQVYLKLTLPILAAYQQLDPNPPAGGGGPFGVPPAIRLAEAILGYSSFTLDLGQEEQTEFQTSRFGSGGGLALQGGGGAGLFLATNSQVQSMNVLKLPEPVEMVRTQNLNVKLKLAPEVFALIGNTGAPGVGAPLGDYALQTVGGAEPVVVNRRLPPYSIEVGLVGRRVKLTQYGQIVRGS